MKNVRVWFEKKGAVRYISHLDLTRNMARGLKLSGLPVWYTEGFNPRIYMTYAMPLSLGVCGERECMDIRLTEEVPYSELTVRLNTCLPRGLRALEAGEPAGKFEEIQYGEYEMALEGEAPAVLEEKVCSLLERETVLVRKHTKKATRTLTSNRILPTPGLFPKRTACSFTFACPAALREAPILLFCWRP